MKTPTDRDRIINWLGFLLIGGAMAWAILGVFRREVSRVVEDTVTIRFAHTLLHAGLREAFDAVARDYEALQAAQGRRVRIVQIPIPFQAYRQWLRTQIIGGTAPEIVYNQYDLDFTMTARFLVPVAPYIVEPNPYNDGTPLEGMRWRDTFFDGLQTAGFVFVLAEHYGIPISATTTRVFANRRLLDQILAAPENAELRDRLGPAAVPRRFEDFIALCEATEAFAARSGRILVPMAGSDANGLLIIERMFGSQTQQLLESWQQMGDFRVGSEDTRLDFLAGEKSLHHPAFLSGFTLVREVGRFIQPGFLQLRREDATFYFTQERALMIVASSWDAPSFRELIGDSFEVAVFPIPLPDRDTPVYGQFVNGPVTEADVVPSGTFSLTNLHPPERTAQALDFLRYLTSVPGNQKFVDRSGWLPAVVEIQPSPGTEAFMPELEGYPNGPQAHFNDNELRRVLNTRYHRLLATTGSVEEFLALVEPAYLAEIEPAIRRSNRDARTNINQQDTVMAAHWWLAQHEPQPEDREESLWKLGMQVDSTNGNEANRYWFELRLRQITGR
jgi:raffinose/stachyose/melibiose transport system substrate-binding protein